MLDREKVVERLAGLKELLKFQKDILGYVSFIEDINDALTLLEEQEAKKTCCKDCEYYGACHS